ncbi:MAG: hypothetical protein MJZ57_07320 [Bacteroidales bacterium]|nr:hypothetical protein [Bacteroidales bacterium]
MGPICFRLAQICFPEGGDSKCGSSAQAIPRRHHRTLPFLPQVATFTALWSNLGLRIYNPFGVAEGTTAP